MTYRVFRDGLATRIQAEYLTLAEALAALREGNALVLPSWHPVEVPVTINVDAVSLYAARANTEVVLGAAVTRFWARGEHAVEVMTTGSNVTLRGNDAGLVLNGGTGRDTATGGAAADRLYGGLGDDNLSGAGGSDILVSGGGRDRLNGGDGADILIATGSGATTMTGGTGADRMVIDLSGSQTITLADFNGAQGDLVTLTGGELESFAGLLATAQVWRTASGHAMLVADDLSIRVLNATTDVFNSRNFVVSAEGEPPQFASFAAFLASGLANALDEIRIGEVTYRLRDAQPLHQDFKYQDGTGRWWSPDYFVVVAGGQSNMDGGASGGDMQITGDVVAYDWVNDRLTIADYMQAPANGPGVRTGTTIRNNLYFPFAEEISAMLDRPVLVIAHPVSGSRIDSWLASGTGTNWANLAFDVEHALGLIGQDRVDTFLWHQGESDYPVPLAEFRSLFLSFVAQVRAQDWAGSTMPFLAGELSRLGTNWTQNQTYQAIETANPDPHLHFVSSVGLTSAEDTGIHFDGPSLVAFGQRFAAVWAQAAGLALPDGPNAAPVLATGVTRPTQITINEGDRLALDVARFFADPDGDDLWFYSYLSRRQVELDGVQGSQIILTPDYSSAGTYTLTIYASDYRLDGASFSLTLTVLDRAPLVQMHSNLAFANLLDSYRDLPTALAEATTNRGIDILSQAAVTGEALLSAESLRIRAGAGITADFRLAEGVTRAFFYGNGALNLTGNAADNFAEGNAGANRMNGVGGTDRLFGLGGNDVLIGGLGNDSLYGGDGNDLIDAGPGLDAAWGGAGADTFILRRGQGELFIRDFVAGQDVVRVEGWAGIDDYGDLLAQAVVTQSSDRTILTLGADRLMISNLNVANLGADLFAFA